MNFDAIPNDLPQYALFVSNLNYKMEEGELRALFEQTGEVLSAKLFTGSDGRRNGMGIVNYKHKMPAVEALQRFGNTQCNGRTLHVEWGKDIAQRFLSGYRPSRGHDRDGQGRRVMRGWQDFRNEGPPGAMPPYGNFRGPWGGAAFPGMPPFQGMPAAMPPGPGGQPPQYVQPGAYPGPGVQMPPSPAQNPGMPPPDYGAMYYMPQPGYQYGQNMGAPMK
jgi:RNA recognition motif-containing protein